MAIVPTADPGATGWGCGHDGASTSIDGGTAILRLSCDDSGGDPLIVTVTRAPEHARAAPPAITVGRFGVSEIGIAWTPDPGFRGVDAMDVTVTDGFSPATAMSFDLYAINAPEPGSSGLPGWPDYPVPPGVAPGVRASRGQARPVAPADQARLALGTREVTLVKRLGDARVYARRSSVRYGLAPVAGKAALAVTCPLECRLDTRVGAGSRRAHTARSTRLARTRGRPGRAARLRLTRRATAILRTAGAVRFDVSVAMRAGAARRGTVKLRRR